MSLKKSSLRCLTLGLTATLLVGFVGIASPASAEEVAAEPTPTSTEPASPPADEPAPAVEEKSAPVPEDKPVAEEPAVEAPAPAPEKAEEKKAAKTTTTTEPKKVWVCKYVGKPGTDERLKDGKNPINVSVNSIPNYNGVGSYFADAQGRSFVVSDSASNPGAAACPPGDSPPPSGHDWKYQVTCDGVSGSRPNTDSVDSNIRIKNLDTGAVQTFNYHGPDSAPAGAFNYTLSNYGVPSSWTHFEIQWVQVNGTNYHWEGAEECGDSTPPPQSKYPYEVEACWLMARPSDGVEGTYTWPQIRVFGADCDKTPACGEIDEYQHDTYWIRDKEDEDYLASLTGLNSSADDARLEPHGYFSVVKRGTVCIPDQPADERRQVPVTLENCDLAGVKTYRENYVIKYTYDAGTNSWVKGEEKHADPFITNEEFTPYTDDEYFTKCAPVEPPATTRDVPHTEESCEIGGVNNWKTVYTTTFAWDAKTRTWVGTEDAGVDTEKVLTEYTDDEYFTKCAPGSPEPLVKETSSTSYKCGDDTQTTVHTTVTTAYVWDAEKREWVLGEPVTTETTSTEAVDVVECPTDNPPTDTPDEPKADTPDDSTDTVVTTAELPNTGGPNAGNLVIGGLLVLAGAGALLFARKRTA